MIRTFKLIDTIPHVIILNNVIENLLICLSVPKSKSNSRSTKSSCSSNSVEIGFWIRFIFPILEKSRCRHIIVYHQLGFRNINTSCYDISCDQNIDLLASELFYCYVSFLFCHFWEHDERMEPWLLKNLVNFFSKIFGIYKNESLCHFTSFENFFYKFKFFSMLTFQNKLLYMRKLQLFSLHSNLLGFIQDFDHSLLNLLIFTLIFILRICGWE